MRTIGIGNAGGGPSVTTTYLDSYFTTLDAGFTCSSGRKYHATRENVELITNQLATAKRSSATTISVLSYTNVYVEIAIAECEADLMELATNEIQSLIHYYG
jgi:predicted transcriptional regulator